MHRSEGAGYGLAEAIALGTSAISTGFSDILDFMNDRNSWLIDYDLPVKPCEHPHAGSQRWAEPRVAQAVELMKMEWRNSPRTRNA